MLTHLARTFTKSRHYSTQNTGSILKLLSNRKLIRITGNESFPFLQGLTTNDMNHLENNPTCCMYTMFLNVKGRVLYDSIIYRTNKCDGLLLECDTNALQTLSKHLKMYKLKKNVNIEEYDNLNVYVMYNPSILSRKTKNNGLEKNVDGLIVPCDSLDENVRDKSCEIYNDIVMYKDPRVGSLSTRILAPKDCDAYEELKKILNLAEDTSQHSYRWFRYNLGLGEGVEDLPPGNCFPLEANCDYLHGVSFHKGCYIGQELTARTHHTGVVRKRYMPLFFTKIPTKLPEDSNIIHNGKNLGKLRGIEEDVGLGLLRISQALNCNEFNVGDGVATTMKPVWWPLEVSKEKVNIRRME